MKKYAMILLIGCTAVGLLAGCGKKNENTGAIISMRDNSTTVNTDLFDQENTDSDKTDESQAEEETSEDINELEAIVSTEELFTLGSWVSDNYSMTLFEDGSASAYFNGSDITGTFESDYSTYITLKYTEKIEIEDASETDILLGKNFTIEEKEIKMDIIKIESDTDANASILTVKIDGQEIQMFKYAENLSTAYDESQSTSPNEEELMGSEMTPEEEEAFRQSLIEQGINPDTGRTFEEDERLRELGIDPLTGEPIVEESTAEE